MRQKLPMAIRRWTGTRLPDGLPELAWAAADEGHEFLLVLVGQWASRASRFDGPGEGLFVAEAGGELLGISAVCRDPYQRDPEVGRLRHVFVNVSFRGQGLAERLVKTCLAHSGEHFRYIRLSTEIR